MPTSASLTPTWFDHPAAEVARALIGATLLVKNAGGIIVETESYHGDDPASHSYPMRRTVRNAPMFGPPGHAYVYRSYGLHWCLNFVCQPGSAVLIRALQPTTGLAAMRRRRDIGNDLLLCAGPGRLCQALAVTGELNNASLFAPPFMLVAGTVVGGKSLGDIATGPRIGISKAKDQLLRFGLAGSRYLSRPFPRS